MDEAQGGGERRSAVGRGELHLCPRGDMSASYRPTRRVGTWVSSLTRLRLDSSVKNEARSLAERGMKEGRCEAGLCRVWRGVGVCFQHVFSLPHTCTELALPPAQVPPEVHFLDCLPVTAHSILRINRPAVSAHVPRGRAGCVAP